MPFNRTNAWPASPFDWIVVTRSLDVCNVPISVMAWIVIQTGSRMIGRTCRDALRRPPRFPSIAQRANLAESRLLYSNTLSLHPAKLYYWYCRFVYKKLRSMNLLIRIPSQQPPSPYWFRFGCSIESVSFACRDTVRLGCRQLS